MKYQNLKTQEDLFQLLNNSQFISGEFLCHYDSLASYDIDCRDKIFKDCIIVRGSFVGTNFTRCIFDNVVFRDTEFETIFEDCDFIDCIFSNVSGFTLKNTKTTNLSIHNKMDVNHELQ